MNRRAAGFSSLALFVLALAACTGVNARTTSFASLAEAQEAIANGWLPSGLPASSYEIRVAYVPDGWQRWGIINFPAADAAQLRAILQPEELSLAGVRCQVPGRIEWWPVQLRQDLDADRIAATGAKAHRARTGNLIFVVNWTQGRAYYWTTER